MVADCKTPSEMMLNVMNVIWNDSQYLFRLTSTFGWEEVVHLCNELENEIEQVVARSSVRNECDGQFSNRDQCNDSTSSSNSDDSSSSLDNWLFHAGSQLMYQDQWGNTPLHGKTLVIEMIN